MKETKKLRKNSKQSIENITKQNKRNNIVSACHHSNNYHNISNGYNKFYVWK